MLHSIAGCITSASVSLLKYFPMHLGSCDQQQQLRAATVVAPWVGRGGLQCPCQSLSDPKQAGRARLKAKTNQDQRDDGNHSTNSIFPVCERSRAMLSVVDHPDTASLLAFGRYLRPTQLCDDRHVQRLRTLVKVERGLLACCRIGPDACCCAPTFRGPD